eukprot:CAMPEP_0178939794 /NCGR_PEP_ID=MMETSP0789-20121207/419_1 /TAXON_ID=3005 /ORGANISM="Rhizosolenia setigera, Strain CCMP 1694" /LENGTH=92 /DNA_ID=CAMNT_0020618697 /DNA_START=9 /DNA_END=287 /DNA_ORIENTATION=+
MKANFFFIIALLGTVVAKIQDSGDENRTDYSYDLYGLMQRNLQLSFLGGGCCESPSPFSPPTPSPSSEPSPYTNDDGTGNDPDGGCPSCNPR